MDLLSFLTQEGISPDLLGEVSAFRTEHPAGGDYAERIPEPAYLYYGREIWEKALAALLAGGNLLLAGPKATGKNVLAENLAVVFQRPLWNVSFHINTDAASLIGTDSYDGEKVVFRPGPVALSAGYGGFCIFDEINMAKNEALAVLHSALDFRRVIEVPGYDRITVDPGARFIATMNYGYAGTRDLNEALSSRFMILSMPSIAKTDLERLLNRSFPGIRPQPAGQFCLLFEELDKKAGHQEISERALDLRGMLDAIGLIQKGIRAGDALEMCIVNKSFDQYEQELIRDVIKSRIPAELGRKELFE